MSGYGGYLFYLFNRTSRGKATLKNMKHSPMQSARSAAALRTSSLARLNTKTHEDLLSEIQRLCVKETGCRREFKMKTIADTQPQRRKRKKTILRSIFFIPTN